MKNTKPKENKCDPRFWPWGIAAVTMGVLGGIAILFWYTPKAYKPVRPGSTEQVSIYLTHELGPQFFNQVQQCQPFELVIPQSELNEIISQEFSSEEFGNVSFCDPHIIFLDKSILIMGTLAYEKVASVLSITAFPIMDNTGKIILNIQSIRLGMVPVTTLVTKLAQKIFDENRSCFEDDPKAEENVQAIIHKEPFDPTFLFYTENSQYQVRITDFCIKQGSLKLTLLPKEV